MGKLKSVGIFFLPAILVIIIQFFWVVSSLDTPVAYLNISNISPVMHLFINISSLAVLSLIISVLCVFFVKEKLKYLMLVTLGAFSSVFLFCVLLIFIAVIAVSIESM